MQFLATIAKTMFRSKSSIPNITYLAHGSEFQGVLHVEGNLRVDGIVHGTVEVRGDMAISSTGLIEGPEIRAHNIVIDGVVKARIVADGKLTLTQNARLEGDVVAKALDFAPGAFYLGYIETREIKNLPGMGGLPELAGGETNEPAH